MNTAIRTTFEGSLDLIKQVIDNGFRRGIPIEVTEEDGPSEVEGALILKYRRQDAPAAETGSWTKVIDARLVQEGVKEYPSVLGEIIHGGFHYRLFQGDGDILLVWTVDGMAYEEGGRDGAHLVVIGDHA